jgi:hypothetical protein
VVPEVPALRRDPVVASMIDLFTKPCRLQADAILDLTPYVPRIVEMMSRQASQFFDWLPYNQGILERVPTVESGQRMLWLRGWFGAVLQQRRAHFAEDVRRVFKNESAAVETIEVYEISEYASQPDPDRKQELFPECRFPVRD